MRLALLYDLSSNSLLSNQVVSAVGWDEAWPNPTSEETLPILFHLPT